MGDRGVYKGYTTQKSRAVLPPTVETTTIATTNYRYVAPPPPPSSGGGTTRTASWGAQRFRMRGVISFGTQQSSGRGWYVRLVTAGAGAEGSFSISSPCGQRGGFYMSDTFRAVLELLYAVFMFHIGLLLMSI